MTLTLPYPPTTNHAYTVSRGRKVKTNKARAYQTAVQGECMTQLSFMCLPAWTRDTTARLKVKVIVHPPDRRKRDLANTEKLAIDAVFDWLGLDDSQIDDLRLVRDEVQTDGLLVVEIETVRT
jgi:crossover junction endodeoxyribonuclease RusA